MVEEQRHYRQLGEHAPRFQRSEPDLGVHRRNLPLKDLHRPAVEPDPRAAQPEEAW